MFIVDTNVLIYARNEDAPQHEVALGWLDGALSGREPVGFAWLALVGFIRLVTRPGILGHPLDVAEATASVEAWLQAPPATVATPTARHASILAGLLSQRGTGGNLTNDAHLGALAIEHDATIVSFDRDFGRFSGLRTLVPGAG